MHRSGRDTWINGILHSADKTILGRYFGVIGKVVMMPGREVNFGMR